MSSTTKKTTKAKALPKTMPRATTVKSSEAATKKGAAVKSEAAIKASAAKTSQADTKAADASKEATLKAPVTAVRAKNKDSNAANPTLVGKPQPVVLGPVMRKKELIDTVVTRTGMKKKDAKPVIEGMLAVLGEALADGRELVLPPLGKVIVRKEKHMPNGKVMIVKVRQSKPAVPDEPKPYSDAAE